jgi:hypothetical protein
LRIKITQFVIGHLAGVKRLATQLSQGHNRIAGGAAAGAPVWLALYLGQQLGTARCVDQGHVALVHAHGLKLAVRDFVFRIDQGVANGVEVVVGHDADQVSKSSKFKACAVRIIARTARNGGLWTAKPVKLNALSLC